MIELFDSIKCSNGKNYQIYPNWKDNGFDFMLSLDGRCVNEVSKWYLNDCFKYQEPICVGENNQNFEYATIESVYDIKGKFKANKRSE